MTNNVEKKVIIWKIKNVESGEMKAVFLLLKERVYFTLFPMCILLK